MIENLPKGCLPDLPDERDYQVGLAGITAVNWEQEFRLPEPPDSDQAQADCCVGEAWSYYHWQLTDKVFSVRSLFAPIALAYGAWIRDGGLRLIKVGQQTQEELPDPQPKTPKNMRVKDGISVQESADDRERDSFVLPNASIDGIAWGIKNYQGVVFGVEGSNDGWKDLLNPVPPFYGQNPEWGHALYAFGFHMHNGQKCIIAKSSWCKTGVKEHHIKDNYFITGHTFNGWTLIPRKDFMVKKYLIKDGEKIGVLVAEGFTFGGGFAKDQKALQQLKEAFEVPEDAPLVNLPNQ